MKKFKNVADGKIPDAPRSLNELMGIRSDPIQKESLEDFKKSLIKMPLHEMQAKAIEFGIKPLPDRRRLQNVLIERFKKLNKSYGGAYEVKRQSKGGETERLAKEFMEHFK